ncbi:ABC transporter ATP-binding protein/permease [Breznakia pachnodae]|uniref:ABC transport system permease protein n=1 Tax=Breznakia pachnodae TaxID=265178 RepID=A0ABU0E6S6_9FIRM|nr:ABC transporter ATP-binding protein/permease [Breznakia pachnodae]MDQ0362421.1 putative ABC transport system permease protein [Breznakia pachnodae]
MIQLKKIKKTYTTGDFTQVALNEIDLSFRANEFVAILGQSGSGKTTLLNILGGLDQYDSGDLIINGRSTKNFKDSDWDAYRNNSVGFVFQSYNLIPHLNILDNIEMSMTLSGISMSEKKERALEVLERVGLKEHAKKKPNQLSGGQMQRVAIARALVNNPDIILADEPTGALDSETSVQIMDLISEIAKDKLVVMVTHNPDLAKSYADRIVELSDGSVVSDSDPYSEKDEVDNYNPKKTSMSFFTALKLSGKNILAKKWRTALTSFASSIGIIGVALVLALSNGFDIQISEYEKGTLSNYPIQITQTAMNIDMSAMGNDEEEAVEYPKDEVVYSYDSSENNVTHTNTITEEYVDYVEDMDSSLIDGISYTRSVNMNILKMEDGKATSVNQSTAGFSTYPSKSESTDSDFLEENYDVLAGSLPKDTNDIVLIVDEYNQVDVSILNELGLTSDDEEIKFDDIVGTEYKLLYNDDYYTKSGDYYVVNGTPTDLSDLYNSENAETLTVTGIIRIKEDTNVSGLSTGIAYSDDLAKKFIENAKQSEVVLAQEAADYNVLNGSVFSSNDSSGSTMGGRNTSSLGSTQTKDDVLAQLGASSVPTSISIYPVDFDSKEKITEYLDDWNDGLADTDQIQYTDMAEMITTLSGSIMSAITIVLVAFAAISLVVSMIMIGIIIYISVLERTREIGVLRSLGARKKDITRVFNAETFIIGTCSGLLGILIAYLLTFPVNSVLEGMTDLANIAQLDPVVAIGLVALSVILTMIGGFIPAKMAAKKDPVEALRSE